MEDVKIKLSVTWAAHFLIWSFGDIVRFLHPGYLDEIIQDPVSNSELAFIVFIGMFQSLMIVLSVLLDGKANRVLNLVFGAIYAIINIAYLFDNIFNDYPFWEIELTLFYLILNVLTVWLAYTWKIESD